MTPLLFIGVLLVDFIVALFIEVLRESWRDTKEGELHGLL